jgi:hypothetical protein
MSKQSTAGIVLLLAALSVAVAGDRQPVYCTPQEVFDTAKKAANNRDWKTFCATLTPESRDAFAGTMVSMQWMYKKISRGLPEDRKEFLAKFKPVEDVLVKYGMTEDALKRLEKERSGLKDPEARKAALRKLVAPIKDRCAFLADIMKAQDEFHGRLKGVWVHSDAELKNVDIEGNRAKAILVAKIGKLKLERRTPVEFRKINDSWKIDLTDWASGFRYRPKIGPPSGK